MTRPLHVAVDGSGLERPWAGVGTYTREVLAALAVERPDRRLTVYTTTAGAGPGREGEPWAVRPLPDARFVGRHVAWPRRLRGLDADVYFGPAGQLPLGAVGMPSVLTVHDLAIYRHPEWFPGGQWLSTRWVVPRSIRRATALIADSRATAADLADLFGAGPGRVTVIQLGVSRRFRPLDRLVAEAARERYRLPDRFILFVGTIEPRKNLLTLLDAWQRMADPPSLAIAGGPGWRADDLLATLRGLEPRVRLLGGVEAADLPALYNLAACLAHPSWYEGFGLTPLEAMACGTPVVSSDAASLPEVVGDAGLLVDPADVEGWTGALERAISDPDLRAELRRRGLLRAADLDWSRTAASTWRVLERAAG